MWRNWTPAAASSARSLSVVVQLAVVDEGQAVSTEWLVPALTEVDDREPAMGQLHRDLPVLEIEQIHGRRDHGAAIRSLMTSISALAVDLLVTTCDPAHVNEPRRSDRWRASSSGRPR